MEFMKREDKTTKKETVPENKLSHTRLFCNGKWGLMERNKDKIHNLLRLPQNGIKKRFEKLTTMMMRTIPCERKFELIHFVHLPFVSTLFFLFYPTFRGVKDGIRKKPETQDMNYLNCNHLSDNFFCFVEIARAHINYLYLHT